METQMIALHMIHDNPYQGRKEYGDIEVLARSIAADDLQEMPKARKSGDAYELKFGHRRCEAFRWLQAHYAEKGLTERYDGYSVMPIDVEAITDEQMYRGAVIENEHRKDVNPIEKARMMLVYRDQFGKSSAQIGELFGMNDATVRGMLRLLDLPEEVQVKVSTGEISQGAARKLLTIARVDATQIDQAVERMASGMSADEVVNQAMRDSGNAFVMWFGWKQGAPLAGEHLWRIDLPADKFPMQYMPALTDVEAAKVLGIELTATSRPQLKRWIEVLSTGAMRGFDGVSEAFDGTPAEYLISQGAPADQIEKLSVLISPPGCSACQLHSVADKQHLCGLKACHKRKVRAWSETAVQKASKKLGIPVYDPSKDGKVFITLAERAFEDEYKAHNKLVESKDSDLRLQAKFDEYNEHKWTSSHFVRVIAVGDIATRTKNKKQEAKANQQSEHENEERKREIERAMRDASRKFIREYAARIFAQVFQGVDNMHAMAALARVEINKSKGTNKEQLLGDLRAELASDMLGNLEGLSWQTTEKGPVAVAKYLSGVATTWGMTLPADFADVAQGHMPVAVETPAPKKSKKS